MDRIEYILRNIYHIFSVAVRLMDDNGKIIRMPFEGFDKTDPVCCNPKLWAAVYESGLKEEKKYIIHDDNGYIYYIFHREDCNIVWGPFLLEPHSEYENHLYLRRNHVEDNQLYISLFDFSKYGTEDLQAVSSERKGEDTMLFGDFGFKVLMDTPMISRKDGVCLILKESKDTFYILGNGCMLTYFSQNVKKPYVEIYSCEEGSFEGGKWNAGRRLNGDEVTMLMFETPQLLKIRLHAFD